MEAGHRPVLQILFAIQAELNPSAAVQASLSHVTANVKARFEKLKDVPKVISIVTLALNLGTEIAAGIPDVVLAATTALAEASAHA
jgi:hypothetical protein